MSGNPKSLNSGRSRHLVAPELAPLLDFLPSFDFNEETLRALQAGTAMPPRQRPPLSAVQETVTCEERFIAGPPGAPDVRLLVYTPPGPKPATGRPAYLHLHGGGYVIGNPELNDGSNRSLAAELNCVVVSVDYRLAPETRFPGALEDCYAALTWLHAQAMQLGVDRSRIAIGGESAGGGHRRGLVSPRAQPWRPGADLLPTVGFSDAGRPHREWVGSTPLLRRVRLDGGQQSVRLAITPGDGARHGRRASRGRTRTCRRCVGAATHIHRCGRTRFVCGRKPGICSPAHPGWGCRRKSMSFLAPFMGSQSRAARPRRFRPARVCARTRSRELSGNRRFERAAEPSWPDLRIESRHRHCCAL